MLLDLHSMQHDTPALTLSGRTTRSILTAQRLERPQWIVADTGHASGKRLIDHPAFADRGGRAIALLVECGQHWLRPTADMAMIVTARFLRLCDQIDDDALVALTPSGLTPPGAHRLVEVTNAVTVETADFAFAEDYVGFEVIPDQGTVIARDGGRDVTTPYDDCILIMPSRRLRPGQTAVRLGRLVAAVA